MAQGASSPNNPRQNWRVAVIVAPPTATNLKGVTRETILALAREAGIAAEERAFTLFDVWTAREAFMCGTLAEIVPIATVDGRAIGTGTAGPITLRLVDAYARLVRSTGTPIARDVAHTAAGVCLLEDARDSGWMQRVAGEVTGPAS